MSNEMKSNSVAGDKFMEDMAKGNETFLESIDKEVRLVNTIMR